jgi:hypothetical protein
LHGKGVDNLRPVVVVLFVQGLLQELGEEHGEALVGEALV